MHLKNRILVSTKYTKIVTISVLLESNCVTQFDACFTDWDKVTVQTNKTSLDYQPLLRKGARTPLPNSPLLWEERRPDSRKRRKSSLIKHENERNILSCLIECLMAFKFYQRREDQTRSNSITQYQQFSLAVKCLVTKQCLMVFVRQAHFPFGEALTIIRDHVGWSLTGKRKEKNMSNFWPKNLVAVA